MRTMGGYGHATTEQDMERHLRTAVVRAVHRGTSAIQRDIIGGSFTSGAVTGNAAGPNRWMQVID
jgi:alkylation response protein AidB-like acyl-CoA dehydrogenase